MTEIAGFSLWDNPMNTDGIEFIEFAAADPAALGARFEALGFSACARHRSKNALLYRQGGINFIVNAEPDSFAQAYARDHGTSICAIALRVIDAAAATERALSLGAWEIETRAGAMELRIPAFQGAGESLIYFVDRYNGHTIYDVDFVPLAGTTAQPVGVGLAAVEQIIQSVAPGRSKEWFDFYGHLFGFRELVPGSRLLTSPCGKIRIRLDEAARDEGIRSVRLATPDLAAAIDRLGARGVSLAEHLPAGQGGARCVQTLAENGALSFEIVGSEASHG
jgi:4-hydroxyphenylpyruvate dioxygenase